MVTIQAKNYPGKLLSRSCVDLKAIDLAKLSNSGKDNLSLFLWS